MHRSLLRTGPSCGPLRRAGGDRGHRVLIARLLGAPGACRTLLQLPASIRPAAPTAEPPEASLTASIAPVTVTLADGTTVTLVEPTPHQLLRYQRAHPAAVTWTGLLGVLALTAAALIAAAAACFMVYIRPMLKALSVTLAAMEQAAKDMQQAADHVESTSQLLQSQLPTTAAAVRGAAAEVQELAGNINKTAKLLIPARFLKQNTTTTSSSSSSGNGAGGPEHEAVQANSGPSSWSDGIRQSGFGPQLQALQNLAAVRSGHSSVSSSDDDNSSGKEPSCASSPTVGDSSSSSSSSSSRTVWDALALTVSSATASKGSLERLRSDLRAAANVISILLTPAGQTSLSDTASKHEEQQQQQQQQEVSEASALPAAPAAPAAAEWDQEGAAAPAAPPPPPAAALPPPAPAAATSIEALEPAAAAAALEDDLPSPLSSVDRRIRIAAGIRRSGSAAVLKSLSEEDIEHALAAAVASSSSSSSTPGDSSSSSTILNSSSSGRDVCDCRGPDDRQVSAPTSQGAEITQAAATAAAGAKSSAVGAYAPATQAAAVGDSTHHSSSRSSSPSGRRRRKSKKIEEDEWGLPTVMNASSDRCNTSDDEHGGSSGGRRSLVQPAADAPAAVGAAAAMSLSAVGADGASAPAPADLPTSSAAGAAAAAAAAARSSSSSYMAPSGWVDLSSDCSDDEDYAGYKGSNNCYDSFDEGLIQIMGSDRHNGGGSSSSSVFAGYDTCQDVHLTARPDDGITWSQLHQDPQLMRRVFCDNQEQILQSGMNGGSSGQPPLSQKPEAKAGGRWHQ